MKAETKRLRQQIATAKEKELLNKLKKLMGGVAPTTRMLKEYKESWIDKPRYKKIKLQKIFEIGRQIMDNANFERDQKYIFKKVEGGTKHVGQIPEMEKFVKFFGDIWKKDDTKPKMS